jgi:NADPH-dependent glutamate synthase beta subunit-like oxidoreductase
MALRSFEHVAVTSLEEAVAVAAEHRQTAVLVAGGTDVLGILKDQVHPHYPKLLIDLKPIAGLAYVRADRKGLKIGALTTLSALAKDRVVKEKYPLLAEAARAVGSPQIRNMGTVGGNLCQEPRCWYYRTPENHFHCLRKGGEICGAIFGDNRFHSIFGAARVGMPACAANCPANVAIPAYLAQVRAGNLEEAARIVLQRNPMPAVTGRVCPHFCELHCNRGEIDQAVSVRAIERQVGDYVLENAARFFRPPRRQTKKKVAIVGAGPAGLAAAYYLRQAGHQVTVFDNQPEAGGMLTYSIPAYRLPKEIVRALVGAYEKTGIEFRLDVDIGRGQASLKALRQNFDSVFLATGAWKEKKLGIEREELLLSGLDFLAGIQRGSREIPGKKVLVIGGGNVAVDVALSALRLGARDVTMACLEGREVMPAFPEDIEGAVREGVKLLPSWGPQKIQEKRGVVTGMELVRCTSVFDAQGRFHPTFDPGVKKSVQADHILLAIGQGADLSYAGQSLKIERGLLQVDGETQATKLEGVFAGGDATTGPASVVAALAAGRRAALAIDAYLGGRKVEEPAPEPLYAINSDSLRKSQRGAIPELALSERTIDAEDVATLDARAVETEAYRCVNCGCVAVNASDLAPALVALDATIKTTKRTVAAADFFAAEPMRTTVLDPDEVVTAIEIPAPRPHSRQSFLKFRIRKAIDFPIVSVASVLAMKNGTVGHARIVLGAVAPVPLRAKQVEEYLVGKAPTEETAEVAAGIAVRGAFPLGKNGYKAQIVRALLRRAILGG